MPKLILLGMIILHFFASSVPQAQAAIGRKGAPEPTLERCAGILENLYAPYTLVGGSLRRVRPQ